MTPGEIPSHDEVKLPVLSRSTTGASILFIALVPCVFVPPFLAPAHVWAWLLAASSLVAIIILYACANLRFFVTGEGLICRAFLRNNEVRWSDVEAIGTEVIQSKYGPIGTIFSVYSEQRVIRPMFAPRETGDFERLIARHCADAVRIDEDRGTFSMPATGDNARLRDVVSRHSRRLRHSHRIAAALGFLVLVPYGVSAFFNGIHPLRDVFAIAVSLLAFAALSWSHWAALWRLRK